MRRQDLEGTAHERNRVGAGVGDAAREHGDVRVRAVGECVADGLDLLDRGERGDVELDAVGTRAGAAASAVLAPDVSVIGIFTCTCSPHDAILCACSYIASRSSENTSNEIGRSGTSCTRSSANDS